MRFCGAGAGTGAVLRKGAVLGNGAVMVRVRFAGAVLVRVKILRCGYVSAISPVQGF